MTRKMIAQAIRQTALELGYCFYGGFDYRMNETIIAYPAVWLSPLKVVAMEGRREGRVRYRVSLQVMALGSKLSAESRELLWEKLEADALDVCRSLGEKPGVVAVKLAECVPAEFTLTNHGELAMGVRMDVDVPFCNL